MTATITQARDEILALFKAEWEADLASQSVVVLWEGLGDMPNSTRTPWVKIRVVHNPVQPGQVTLSGEQGQRRFRRIGAVLIEIYTGVADGLILSDNLSTVARRAFEGKSTSPGDVIFRTVSVNEIGVEAGGWFQTNVTATFEYDEIL